MFIFTAQKYCPLLKKEGGEERITSILHNPKTIVKIKDLAHKIIKNLHMDPDNSNEPGDSESSDLEDWGQDSRSSDLEDWGHDFESSDLEDWSQNSESSDPEDWGQGSEIVTLSMKVMILRELSFGT